MKAGDLMLLRFLQLLLAAWLIYVLLRLFFRVAIRWDGPAKPEKSPQGEDMVRDPQCGTYIPVSLALKKVVHGRTHYFCSEECRKAYKPPGDEK
jgi:uncharacterized protein